MPSSPRMPLHRLRDIGILPAHELRAGLDHRHAAAESAVGLGHFEADIAAAEHDQMRGHVVEFEHLDVRERPGVRQAGMFGIVACVPTLRKTRSPDSTRVPPSFEAHLQRFRRDEPPAPHDQLGAARP